jgi:hypothetical protein
MMRDKSGSAPGWLRQKSKALARLQLELGKRVF